MLPWVVGALGSLFLDLANIGDTVSELARWFAALVLPMFLAMMGSVAVKVRRDLHLQAEIGRRGFSVFAETVERHTRVLTSRGVSVLVVAMVFLILAIGVRWAQFGVVAATALGLLYALAAITMVISAFSVHSFDERVQRRGGAIRREVMPPVVNTGDPVEQWFHLDSVPVPPGYQLHIQDELPARLGGETRFLADGRIRRSGVSMVSRLSRTPRGEYTLGPARMWFEDLLGLTQIHVAVRARTQLRVLPRFRTVLMAQDPQARSRAEGVLSRLHRQPTEDWFHVREYTPGDDARRVHWKLSVRLGTLHVRVPETVPFAPRRVRLAVDSMLPKGLLSEGAALGEVLDLLVEGWLSIARALVRRGEDVTLVAVAPDPTTRELTLRELRCRRGNEMQWRALGASIQWQSEHAVVPADDATEATVTVTAGLGHAPTPADGAVLVRVHAPDSLPARAPRARWIDLALHAFPTGSVDNRAPWTRWLRDGRRARQDRRLNAHAIAAARRLAELADRFDTAYTLRRRGASLELE